MQVLEPRRYCGPHIRRALELHPEGLTTAQLHSRIRKLLSDAGADPWEVQHVHVRDACAALYNTSHLAVDGRGRWTIAEEHR